MGVCFSAETNCLDGNLMLSKHLPALTAGLIATFCVASQGAEPNPGCSPAAQSFRQC